MNAVFQAIQQPLVLKLLFADITHLTARYEAGPDEHHVLENDPARVFQRPPRCAESDSVNGLRIPQPTEQMVNGHNYRGRREDPPIPIAREKRQRPEDVEMCFNPSAGQMNQQTGKANLADGHGLTSQRLARQPPDQYHGKETEYSAQQDRGINVRMHRTNRSAPGARRDDDGEQNPHYPLHGHQDEEQPVNAPVHLVFVGAVEFVHRGMLRTVVCAGDREKGCIELTCHRGYRSGGSCWMGHPKTGMDFWLSRCPRRIAITACFPALSPSCPREAVMPP